MEGSAHGTGGVAGGVADTVGAGGGWKDGPGDQKHTDWQGGTGGGGGAVAEPASVDEDSGAGNWCPERVSTASMRSRSWDEGRSVETPSVVAGSKASVKHLAHPDTCETCLPKNQGHGQSKNRRTRETTHKEAEVARRMEDRRGGRGRRGRGPGSTSEQGNNATTRVT